MNYVRWDIPDKGPLIPAALVEAGCTPLLAALLALRGIGSPEDARRFLSGGAEELCDPMLLPDMPPPPGGCAWPSSDAKKWWSSAITTWTA